MTADSAKLFIAFPFPFSLFPFPLAFNFNLQVLPIRRDDGLSTPLAGHRQVSPLSQSAGIIWPLHRILHPPKHRNRHLHAHDDY